MDELAYYRGLYPKMFPAQAPSAPAAPPAPASTPPAAAAPPPASPPPAAARAPSPAPAGRPAPLELEAPPGFDASDPRWAETRQMLADAGVEKDQAQRLLLAYRKATVGW